MNSKFTFLQFTYPQWEKVSEFRFVLRAAVCFATIEGLVFGVKEGLIII
jgi:hypothetical protein